MADVKKAAELDLTPPTKAAKAPKAPKAEKAPKAPADPNAPKKERAPRTDYGFAKDATITVVPEKGATYRGQRKEWFELLSQFNGKSVNEFFEAAKAAGKKDPPRGWLRFYVQDGAATLTAAPVAAPAAA